LSEPGKVDRLSKKTQEQAPLVLLIDGHSLAYRSYYAHSKGQDGGLRTSTGIPTSISFGFIKTLMEVLDAKKPQYLAIAFDRPEPTFRHERDEKYKADRPEAPDDFYPDLDNLKALLTSFNLQLLSAAGYEADDVIGTLTDLASREGYRVQILSGDRDLFQLVDDDHQVQVLYLSSIWNRSKAGAGPEPYNAADVEAKMGVSPAQVVDYKALCGDTSDRIPGVPGVGAKTATDLLKAYESLDQVYANLDNVAKGVREKLTKGRDSAYHSQFLAQIVRSVPLDIDLGDCKLQGFEEAQVAPWLEKLEFRMWLKKLAKLNALMGGTGTIGLTETNASAELMDDETTWFFSQSDTAEAQAKRQHNAGIKLQPQIIDTPEKLSEFVQHLKTLQQSQTATAWDTETTSLSPRDAEWVGIGCGWGAEPDQMAYLPLGHRTGTNLDRALVLEHLRPFLEDPNVPKVFQNAKFDRLVLRSQGIEVQGILFDTMLASYVLNPERDHNLTDLSRRYLSINPISYGDLVPKGKTIADIPIPQVADYCGMDVYTTWRLYQHLNAELSQIPALQTLFETVELPLERVLADMETCGIRIDQVYLHEFSKQLEQDLQALEQQAYTAAGTEFNLGSPKQLSELLFGTLGLSTRKSRKTTLGYSTDAATLEKLEDDHPVIPIIQEVRTLSKLKSTYVDALPALVRSDTQRLHTNYNQTVTATGRLSSSDPNLQNIPIRTAFSRQIRQAFLPEAGWLMAAADYSQIELRILAHLSQEPVLLETYQRGQDVHALTARLLLDKDDISSEERRMGKIINFGVIYGMGAQRFARETGVSLLDARVFIDRFNQRYPLVFEYLQRMKKHAIAQGYVETILGRRRYFSFVDAKVRSFHGSDPDSIDLDQLKIRNQGDSAQLRAAANAPIQGSSADIIKIAMVRLHEALNPYQSRILLQVHDELVLEVPPDEWDAVRSLIQATMETAVALSIPLVAEVHAGQNWMDAK
jgi:DNA polymerase I